MGGKIMAKFSSYKVPAYRASNWAINNEANSWLFLLTKGRVDNYVLTTDSNASFCDAIKIWSGP